MIYDHKMNFFGTLRGEITGSLQSSEEILTCDGYKDFY